MDSVVGLPMCGQVYATLCECELEWIGVISTRGEGGRRSHMLFCQEMNLGKNDAISWYWCKKKKPCFS